MRQALLLLTAIFFFLSEPTAKGQDILMPLKKNVVRCYTDERLKEFQRTHPGAETTDQFEAWLGKKIKERKQQGFRPLTDYTIPIVFHIIHNGEAVGTSPNLDASLIQEQILQLNKDFSNQSNSPYAVAAATGLHFVLAQNDPSGNALPEPGIDRINRNDNGWTDYSNGWSNTYIDNTVKPASIWNAAAYFNVWVIPALSSGTTELLGYSTFPASSSLSGLNNNETNFTAGVVIVTSTVGSAYAPGSCGNGYGLGKTLSHESGHFFGLRHIWGDANCGNDYCDDTPIHFTLNRGVPSHPKPNSCGTPDEMFENYMDYSDDVVLNTFTQDQADRMQTVMVNSPRRLSLTTSAAGGAIVTASNNISFIYCDGKYPVSEKATSTVYPGYKDVSLTLNVEDKATGNAIVTVTTSGTAVSGKDYTLLTPTLNFTAGDNFRPIKIRILDNPLVDGTRTIIVNYTISGTGVSAGTDAQSVTVNLTDDDNMRVGENTIKLLDETFENPTGSLGLPANWRLLTTTGYVNKFVVSANGDAGGSGLCAHITNNTSTKPNIYTKGVSGAAVLQSPVIDAASVLSLGDLSFTYTVAGLVDHDDAYLTYTMSDAQTGPFYYFGSNQGLTGYGPYASNNVPVTNAPVLSANGALDNKQFNLSFYWETGTLATGTNPGFNVDNISLSATPFHIETAVSSSNTFDIVSGSGINNFKSTNNKAVATITNASTNITGLTAQVTAAGTGRVALNTGAGSYLRTQKVFQLSPATPNTTTIYQATLYFTEAELAVWGADKLNLKILKIKDGVSLNSTLNTSNSELIIPTAFEDAAAGYISYTGSFTGFSQFVLVSPLTALPINLISFQASALQKSVQLVWKTAQEVNNKGFFVERSLDGNIYTKIGWVNGNGNTAIATTWNFTDNYVQPGVTYYYRIRQVDIDNRQSYSVIRNARLKPGAGISIIVSPNPVKDFANVFITGTTSKASIELINNLGQKLVQQNGVNAVDGIYNLPLNGIVKGIYTIVVYLPEGAYTKKILVQ